MAKFVIKGMGGKERYFIDMRQVAQEEFDTALALERAALPQVGEDASLEGNRPWSKPILSDALAVHPSQIPEVMERNARHGLQIEYEGEFGRPILTDRDQRRRLMRLDGCHDNDGGYGD